MEHLLTIPEELFLLTVNERTGRKAFLKSKKFDVLLSASILMDLSLHNRLDTDIDYVIPVQSEPTGHPLLDLVMDKIFHSGKPQKISWWLTNLAEDGPQYRESLVKELLHQGLISMEKEHVFLGFSSTTYPIRIRDQEVIEVKTRVKQLVFNKELPEIRDVVIISLAWYGGLLNLILTDEEIKLHQQRIEQIARMDFIGQAVSSSMQEVTHSILGFMRTKEIFSSRTPEEKLEELVEEMKALMHLDKEDDLPEWLRKGTEQYQKTLDFVRKTGTNEIVFNKQTGKYGLKAGANPIQTF